MTSTTGFTWDHLTAVMRRLHSIARYLLSERGCVASTADDLRNETLLRLLSCYGRQARWQDERHFLSVFRRTARHVLIDQYRLQRAEKRPSVVYSADLGEYLEHHQVDPPVACETVFWLHFSSAVEAVRRGGDDLAADMLVLRFGAGLSCAEAAAAVRKSPRQARRLYNNAVTKLEQVLA